MSRATTESSIDLILDRISALRRVDQVIDLSRGWLQLRILITIGDSGASIDEVVRKLGIPRKTLFDSLRKMKSKGLVELVDGDIKLTDRGVEVYNILRSIASSNQLATPARVSPSLSTHEVLSLVTRYVYLYEVLVALGSSPRYELSLDSLSSIVRISSRQLDEHLSIYTKLEPRLFQRVVRQRRIGFFQKSKVYYRLTREGAKVLHRLPDYIRYKRSLSSRILVSITRTLHPRLVLKRLVLILSVGSAVFMTIAAFVPELGSLVLGAWLVVLSFLSVLVIQSY